VAAPAPAPAPESSYLIIPYQHAGDDPTKPEK
jgi:hypothetical protein